MTDSQTGGTDQSVSEAPKPQEFDLSAITNAIKADFDQRFQGFQSLLDRRTSEFQRELEALKTADLSPEEQEQHRERKSAEQIARLERENALLKMRKQYPEEVDFLEEFLGQESYDAQLQLLANFRRAQAEAEAQGAESTEQPTPVNRNNPPRKQDVSLADMDGEMTKELADKILDQSNVKGMLRKLRGG